MSGRRVSSFELANGITLEYALQGEPAAGSEPVILLHGVTDSWRSFEAVLDELPAGMEVYAVSLRGHGNSSRPAIGYGYQDLAADLDLFADAVVRRPAVIAGHSMGAMVAQQFAIDFPARVAALVLMGGWTTMKDHAAVREFRDSALGSLSDPIDPEFVRQFQLSTVAGEAADGVVERAVAESLKVPAHVWREAFDGFLRTDFSHRLGTIAAPVALAWGDRDVYSRWEDQQALLRALPQSRLIRYEGAGHAFHWEAPARFAADLARFTRFKNAVSTPTAASAAHSAGW